ncbi:MAG: rod shape-determining protein [Rhodoferax sp.]
MAEPPEVAVLSQGKGLEVCGVGIQARLAPPTARVVNPFAHPRTLVSDFTTAELLLKAFVKRLQKPFFLALSPSIVVHPQGDPEGGYTQIEARALHELALGAGATEVVVWQGPALSDQELLARHFPAEGKILS